jgi:hypothetical protein
LYTDFGIRGQVERNTVNTSGIAQGRFCYKCFYQLRIAINNLVVISSMTLSSKIFISGQAFGNGVIVSTSGIVTAPSSYDRVNKILLQQQLTLYYITNSSSFGIYSVYLTSLLATKNLMKVHKGAYGDGVVNGVFITTGTSINNEVNISGHCKNVIGSNVCYGTSSDNILNVSGYAVDTMYWDLC